MGKQERILVVDDDPAVLRILDRMLGKRFDVVTLGDSLQGLEAASEEPFDLIILDVAMPVMDGRTMAGRLRQQPSTRDVPILMLTGLAGREDMLEGYAAGADAYMTKPFDGEALWDSASRLIRGRPM